MMISINNLVEFNKNLSVMSTYSDRFLLCKKSSFVVCFTTVEEDLNSKFLKIFNDIFDEPFSSFNFDGFQISILNSFLSVLMLKPKYVIFNDVLTYFDKKQKKCILKYLKVKNIKVINFTSNPEELLIYNYIVLIDDMNIVSNGTVKDVLSQENKIKSLGYSLPFIVDLSLQLKDYGLIDDIYVNDRKLIDDLWN